MKRIGLIGGMSWESTAIYYRRLNEQVRDTLGGLNSADLVLRSVNFEDIVALQKRGAWDDAAGTLSKAARDLEQAGAEMILICTNTMHLMADAVQAAVAIPLVHIADVTGRAVRDAGCRRPLLLATLYTMEKEFYRRRMEERFGLEVLVPDAADRRDVHDIIFGELCRGGINASSKQRYLDIVAKGKAAGADSLILGCTEIGLLVDADDFDMPTFDSTLLHADAAIELSLASEPDYRSHSRGAERAQGDSSAPPMH
jgi:aspartate racemase